MKKAALLGEESTRSSATRGSKSSFKGPQESALMNCGALSGQLAKVHVVDWNMEHGLEGSRPYLKVKQFSQRLLLYVSSSTAPLTILRASLLAHVVLKKTFN